MSVIYCPDLVVNIKLAVDKRIVGIAAESGTKIKKFYIIDSWWHFNSETILGAGFFFKEILYFFVLNFCAQTINKGFILKIAFFSEGEVFE